jgi:LacI family transcriptional regulator
MNACYEECDSILRGIAHFQKEHEPWDVLVDDDARAASDPGWIASDPWTGVISRATTEVLVAACARKGVPLVDMDDCAPFPGVPKFRPDNVAVGHMAAEDLYERGYRHLYFCGYENQAWSGERCDGFFEAVQLLGMEAGEFLSTHGGATMTPTENATAVTKIAAWLRTLPRPAGIMAAHDLRGRQVLAAAQRAGLRVPDDLAVIGVNNEELRCELSVPSLSSVATDAFRAGYLAAEALARDMRGERGVACDVRVEPLKVVTRRSTDNLAIADRPICTALTILREQACAGLTVAELMRQAHISRSRLERGFRHYLGRSPQAEIRRIQVARIKQLLVETDLPLKDIASRTGFEHVEYLSVVFKREVGESPGRFRKGAHESKGARTGSFLNGAALVDASGAVTAA